MRETLPPSPLRSQTLSSKSGSGKIRALGRLGPCHNVIFLTRKIICRDGQSDCASPKAGADCRQQSLWRWPKSFGCRVNKARQRNKSATNFFRAAKQRDGRLRRGCAFCSAGRQHGCDIRQCANSLPARTVAAMAVLAGYHSRWRMIGENGKPFFAGAAVPASQGYPRSGAIRTA